MGESDMAERWLAIPNYDGLYEISDQGQIKALAKLVPAARGRTRRLPERIMKPQRGSNGYAVIMLSGADRVRLNHRVHVLVCTAFHGPRPSGQEVRHLNGNRTDNRASNVTWGTRSENALDRTAHGTNPSCTRERCAEGHLLSGSNLPSRGGRHCVACHGANTMSSYWSRKGVVFDRAADADRRYLELNIEPGWSRPASGAA